MEVMGTVPVLPIYDAMRAQEFYINYLGFRIDEGIFHKDDYTYVRVSRGRNLKFHLSQRYSEGCPGVTMFIHVRSGLTEFHKELVSKNYVWRPELTIQMGEKQMVIIDPFGNKLKFAEQIGFESKQ